MAFNLCQFTTSLTPQKLSNLEAALSPERLGPYKSFVQNHTARGIQLYSLNSDLAAALFDVLHVFEITLRNAMDRQLSNHFKSQRWMYDNRFTSLLNQTSTDKLNQAIHLSRHNPLPGKVIAELSFGFWKHLYASNYYQTLWQPCLQNIWPQPVRTHATGLDKLRSDLECVRVLRNRIAHHELIFTNAHHRKTYKATLHRLKQLSQVSKEYIDYRTQTLIDDIIIARNTI